jgi:hypothetical protein
MAPANNILRASIPSLAAFEHRPQAPKMPAGGLTAHNALTAHPPQRKSGHFRCPQPSTHGIYGRAKPPMRHIRGEKGKIRGHLGLLALLRLARQSPYALPPAGKKTSGAFQLIATSLTEYAARRSTAQSYFSRPCGPRPQHSRRRDRRPRLPASWSQCHPDRGCAAKASP